jgi:Coenzyme PQQ synthesis protein D (PqqD)
LTEGEVVTVISSAKRVAALPDVLANVVDGETVFLNLKSESYFGLDEVGTRMWQVLTTSESVQVAYETLLAEYEVEKDQLQRDLDDLIEQLVGHELVEVVDA